MKKILLLIIMCVPALLSAQNGVKVSNLAVNAGTVTFDVRWDEATIPPEATPWSDSVWVFVDYNDNGTMKRLPLLPGATLTATSPGGEVIEEPGNNKGVWVHGNAKDPSNSSGSFSATVKLLFNAATSVAGACAYASNYPPVGDYISAANILFKGTPPFIITLKEVGSSATITTQASDGNFFMPGGYEYVSFTDKTGAPGRLGCISLTAYDLKVSATDYCSGTTVTFALSNTTSGRTYRLYNGATVAMDALTGTGGPATFTGAFSGGGVYTAQVLAEGNSCGAVMKGSYTVSMKNLPTSPTIDKPDDACLNSGNNIVFEAKGYSGTVDWVSNGGGSVNGNQVTFTSSATGTKTVVARSAQVYSSTLTCYSGTVSRSATVHALPTVVSSSGAARCGSGTVTLSATASSGAVIDWYGAATGGSVLNNGTAKNSFTTPSIGANTTYYAQARDISTGCVSVARTAVSVTINAVPTITRSGGNASQTVNQFTAISAISYTASNATSIALGSGSFPTGVTGTPNGLVFTVSGTPTVSGTFNYGVTASHTNGCTSAASTGAITVNAVNTDFYSLSTWSYGGYTWSDRVVAKPSGCSQVTTLSTTTSASPPAQYTINSESGVERYYYNWTCAQAICHTGWSLPSKAQIDALVSATNSTNLTLLWGLGGRVHGSQTAGSLEHAYYWSRDHVEHATYSAYSLLYSETNSLANSTALKYFGFQVRCVK